MLETLPTYDVKKKNVGDSLWRSEETGKNLKLCLSI